MKIKRLNEDFSICKVENSSQIKFGGKFCFFSKTDEELSLVCLTSDIPMDTIQQDDGWKGMRIQGILDFSLIGVLSQISEILAANEIGIFAISTYNTDYILVKKEKFEAALQALASAGYVIE